MNRRMMLIGASASFAAAIAMPRLAFAAAATQKRLVFIIQRGAADGLSIVAPTGDPHFEGIRGSLGEDIATGLKLDSSFRLHPALQNVGGLFDAKQALFAHAAASPYRSRSHFDGQNILESGGSNPYQMKDGWLNRLLGIIDPDQANAIAIASTIPLALRGRQEVASYAPSALPDASEDLMARVSMMYRGDDRLHSLWAEALETRLLTSDLGAGGKSAHATGELAARLLQPDDGARIAMIETGGWDTHGGQRSRMVTQLRGLDQMILALRDGLGPVWNDTLVLIATEFGRTVAVNGTGGTDHGTGAVAMLVGGAVNGGRVVADWPGLAPANLHEGRDLKPTLDLDAMIAGALAEHYALDPAVVMARLFPTRPKIRALEGLIRHRGG